MGGKPNADAIQRLVAKAAQVVEVNGEKIRLAPPDMAAQERIFSLIADANKHADKDGEVAEQTGLAVSVACIEAAAQVTRDEAAALLQIAGMESELAFRALYMCGLRTKEIADRIGETPSQAFTSPSG